MALFDRLKKGDERAFSEVYALFAPGLIRYVSQKMGDLTHAQDIVHDIFTKLWDQRKSLQIDRSPSAYLYRQALNRCLNDFRHRRVVEEYVVQSLAEFLVAHPETPDQRLLDAELGEAIQQQIETLAPRMRETIELRLHMGYSNKEIAAQLNVSEHTVATQIKRALKVLRGKIRYVMLLLTLF